MGQAKEYHGMNKAKFRGINKVQIQFLLTAAAINLKKMAKILDVRSIKYSFIKFECFIFRKLNIRYAI